MSSSKYSDLERAFAAAIYLPEASPPRFLSWGWLSNFVGPESRQIHSVKLLQYALQHNQTFAPLHTMYITTPVLIHSGKGRGGGSVEPVRREEGQQGRVQITKLGRKYRNDLKGV
jgi:hypothetical protein